MLSLCKSLAKGTVKGLSALAFGGAILWQVYNHCGATKAVAYVHVTATGVDVTVDDQTYRVETLWDTPIVCELPPGRHRLRMLRSGLVLFEEEFTLEPSQEVVLTAWEQLDEKPVEERRSNVAFNPSLARSRPDGESQHRAPEIGNPAQTGRGDQKRDNARTKDRTGYDCRRVSKAATSM